MKNILNKISRYLSYAIIALAMIMMVNLGISLKNSEVPSVFNRAILYIKTGSMEDTIMTGDLIFVNTNVTEFHEEDIVSFRKPDQPEIIITHRIVSITGDLVTTKGDNNFSSESWEINFSKDLIVGKYVGKSALLGSVYEVMFVNSLNVVFGLIILIFMLIGIIEMKNIIKLMSEKKQIEYEEEKQKLIEVEKAKLKDEMKE
ncbi:MAG: signal peptidase I [Candidatus Izemoplasmatales bacterium]|nr:signal peptidase I [Candidatus Izemoplasmatales bacterium]